MAAIQGTRISSPVAGMLVVAVSAALLLGGVGGYVVRALSSQAPAQATVVESRSASAAAQVPAWVQAYGAPVEAPQFKVDEFIAGLSYSQAAAANAAGQLPSWVQQYSAPAAEPQFKVDEFIRSLSYSHASDLTSTGK